MMCRNGMDAACVSRAVQTVYMPSGNTMPQYCGSYVQGKTPDDVPPHAEDEQQRDPPRRGRPEEQREAGEERPEHRHQERPSRRRGSASSPASVVMATAPMLIQYGGVSRSIVSRET